MSLDLYYVPASPHCRAVQLAASALGVKLNLKLTDLMKEEHLKPEYLKINAQHTVPTLDDNGLILTESRAIIAYLANQYGKDNSFYPKDPKKRAIVDQRCYFDMGTISQRFAELYYDDFKKTATIFAKEPYDKGKVKKLGEGLGYLDEFLSKTTYAAGESITIADCTLAASISTVEVMDFDLGPYPNIRRWLKLCKETLPQYATSNQAGVDDFKSIFHSIKEANKKEI